MKTVQAAIAALTPNAIASRQRPADPEIAELSDQTVSRQQLDPGELEREVKQLGKRWRLAGRDLIVEVHDRNRAAAAALAPRDGEPIERGNLPAGTLSGGRDGSGPGEVGAARVAGGGRGGEPGGGAAGRRLARAPGRGAGGQGLLSRRP